jgi:hypothetical protein
MLDVCDEVNAFEFVPSVRDDKETMCHYWNDTFLESTFPDEKYNCTFLEYHPMKTEKLALLKLNTGDDEQVYGRGYVSLPGFRTYDCQQ